MVKFFYKYKIPVFLFAVFCFLFPSGLSRFPGYDLDSSWMTAINLALKNGLVFGKDFVFTYGPLGYLFTRNSLGIPIIYVILFDIFYTGICTYMVYYILKNNTLTINRSILIFVGLLLLKYNRTEDTVLITCSFWLLLFIQDKKLLHLIIPFILCTILFFSKVNVGIMATIILYSSLIFFFLQKMISLKQLLVLFISQSIIIGISCVLLNVDFANYLITVKEIIAGYNNAMFKPIYPAEKLNQFAIFSLVAVIFTNLLFYKNYIWKPISIYRILLIGLLIFIAFKNGFVRADDHRYIFIYSLPLILGLHYFFEEGKVKSIIPYLFVWSSIFPLTHLIHKNKFFSTDELKRNIPYNYVQELINKNEINQSKTKEYENLGLPDTILNIISSGTVDIMPIDIFLVKLHDLNYHPRPVPQSYSAYTKKLDELNAEFYASAQLPEFVIYSNSSIDNRYPFWDESITKRQMLSNYFPADTFKYNRGEKEIDAMLLVKRGKPLTAKSITISHKEVEFGETIKVDSTNNILLLYADIKYTIWGKLRSLFFQPPLVSFSYVSDKSREISNYRAVLPILKTGVIINKKITSTKDAYLFFQYIGNVNEIDKICFSTNNPISFKDEIVLTFEEITFTNSD